MTAKETEELDIAEIEKRMELLETSDTSIDDPELRRMLEQQRVQLGDACERHSSGGLRFTNERIMAFQRAVVWEFIQTTGWNFLSGKATNLVSVSLPVKIFEPRSFLQRLVDGWWHAPDLLTKAALSDDPLFRLQCITAFAISGFKHTVKQWKPFNPILGETFQAEFDDGTQIYVEQTSHHPPVSHWQVFGKDGLYKYYGYARWDASFRGNALKGMTHGPNIVEFADGTKISFQLPFLWLKGILWGDRVAEYLGEFKVRYRKHGLEASLNFNPDAVGFIQSFFVTQEQPSDLFRGDILQNGKKISSCEGSWLTHIEFNKQKFFDFSQDSNAHQPNAVEQALPSDSRNRDDLIALQNGDYDDASEKKRLLEEIQRKDRKLRSAYKDRMMADMQVSGV